MSSRPKPAPIIDRPLFCIDIGNTHAHYGVVGSMGTLRQGSVRTRMIDHPIEGIAAPFAHLQTAHGPFAGIAFCTVVPRAAPLLCRVLEKSGLPLFHLTHTAKLGLPITYPHPAEIGQDRLANAVGANTLFGSPAIVIDLGTAVTFDLVTTAGGYEGGIIAPGIDVMRSYLHERTAQLPLLGEAPEIVSVIGRSTIEAMHIGTVLGFAGMIQALLDAVLAEFSQRGERPPHLLVTGGAAPAIADRLHPHPQDVPDLTLHGLAAAYWLNRS